MDISKLADRLVGNNSQQFAFTTGAAREIPRLAGCPVGLAERIAHATDRNATHVILRRQELERLIDGQQAAEREDRDEELPAETHGGEGRSATGA